MSTVLLAALALYVAAGVVTGAAFVTVGAARFAHHMTFTLPARLVLFPGAALLWPYVLYRWRRARSDEP